MKVSKIILTISVAVILLAFSGCGMLDMAQVPHKDVENWRTFDPNDYDIKIVRKENGTISYEWSLGAHLGEEVNILPYWKHSKAFLNDNYVEGQLNGNTYPVIFDTGCNPVLVISEQLVTENDLPVFFVMPEDKNNSSALAIADSLKIGSFELKEYPCVLWRSRAEFRLFGVPIHKPEMILVSLNIMRQFSYFKFDGIQDELSFSKQSSFEPEIAAEWLSLPFRFEGLHLLLDISIEGIETTLMLDTGAGYQLELSESFVQELLKKRHDFKKTWKKTTHYYGPYADGKVKQKKFTAKQLQFANQTLNRVEIVYGDHPFQQGKPFEGTIGSELFENTIMVLDFENNMMWIKKAKGSRFEG